MWNYKLLTIIFFFFLVTTEMVPESKNITKWTLQDLSLCIMDRKLIFDDNARKS